MNDGRWIRQTESTAVRKRKVDAMRRCTRCGSEINDKAKVCPVCGMPVDEERAHLRRMVVIMLVAVIVVAALLVLRSRQLSAGADGLAVPVSTVGIVAMYPLM
ncbi:zinc-ribbon domain-containing protein [Bifidobacterium anseris]|nr:DUF2116 family Zn-ribbon domain-containing protein [Bifidobacterium anseris]